MFSPVNPKAARESASSPRPLHKLKPSRDKKKKHRPAEGVNPAKEGEGIDTVFTDALSNEKLYR